MARRSLIRNIEPVRGLSPRAAAIANNTAQNTQAVDTQGSESILFLTQTGTLDDAAATFAIKLQDRDLATDSWVDVSDANTLGHRSFDQSNDNTVYTTAYKGIKRYVRLVITPTGNAGNAPLSVVAVKGHLDYSPSIED